MTFTGLVPPAEVAAQLRAADVLVLPNPASAISSAFTSPLKLFEYMAAGRPIVATDLPSMREVLHAEENALLVEPGNAAGARRRHPPGASRTPALAARLAGRGDGDGGGVHVGAPRRAARSRCSADLPGRAA